MRARRLAAGEGHEAILSCVADAAREGVGIWFPELDGSRLRTSMVEAHQRPRCLLYQVALTDGCHRRDIVVKVRHADPALRRVDRHESRRPVLTPERTLSVQQTARREYDGLKLVEAAFRGADPARFGVLRPLAWLPEHSAIVMDRVVAPTLRDVLSAHSRLRRIRPRRLDPRPWRNAGSWLYAFHRADTSLALDERMARRESVVDRYAESAHFLASVGQDASEVRALSATAARRALADLPEYLPLGTGHGDFTAQNIFTFPSGQITVFDSMPLWRVPIYEDIARITVGIRVFSQQALSQGLAFRQGDLDTCEKWFLEGYFGEGSAPLGAVRAYQALLLLDSWSLTVSKQVHGGRARRGLRTLRVRASSRFLRREASRLISGM